MAVRIGINGFGRMGKLGLRAGWGRPELEFVYDNEWGYVNRMMDIAQLIARSL